MTNKEKKRLVQMLTSKFSVDELYEFTSLLKKDKCKVEIDLNLVKQYKRDIIYNFAVFYFGDENSQLREETRQIIEIYLAN